MVRDDPDKISLSKDGIQNNENKSLKSKASLSHKRELLTKEKPFSNSPSVAAYKTTSFMGVAT